MIYFDLMAYQPLYLYLYKLAVLFQTIQFIPS